MHMSVDTPRRDIASLRINNFPRLCLKQHAPWGKERDLSIRDSDVIVGDVGGRNNEAVHDEEIKGVHLGDRRRVPEVWEVLGRAILGCCWQATWTRSCDSLLYVWV